MAKEAKIQKVHFDQSMFFQQPFTGQNIQHPSSYSFTIVNVFMSLAHPRPYFGQGLKFEEKMCNTRDIFIRCYKRFTILSFPFIRRVSLPKKLCACQQTGLGRTDIKEIEVHVCV